jgi:beta-alanine--pyruvate transaminase
MTETHDLESYWMPFTGNRSFKSDPLLMASAAGMYFTTTDGHEVLDGIAGLWCCNAGHCHPRITEALQTQAATLDYSTAFSLGHPGVFELANRLTELAPGSLDYAFFTNSGSESVDTALKIALAYHRARGEGQRTRLIGREKGYHGVGFGGISVGGLSPNRKMFSANLIPGVDHLPHTHYVDKNAFTRGQPEWGVHLRQDTRYTMERKLKLEGWLFSSSRRWNVNLGLDANAGRDVMSTITSGRPLAPLTQLTAGGCRASARVCARTWRERN